MNREATKRDMETGIPKMGDLLVGGRSRGKSLAYYR